MKDSRIQNPACVIFSLTNCVVRRAFDQRCTAVDGAKRSDPLSSPAHDPTLHPARPLPLPRLSVGAPPSPTDPGSLPPPSTLLAAPPGKLLDYLLGSEHHTLFRRTQLKVGFGLDGGREGKIMEGGRVLKEGGREVGRGGEGGC
jgi:hypothetical protein